MTHSTIGGGSAALTIGGTESHKTIETGSTTLNQSFEFLAMAYLLSRKFIANSNRVWETGTTCTPVALPDMQPCSQIPVLSFPVFRPLLTEG